MRYYEVRIAGRAYHSKKPLTYSHEDSLPIGCIVTVPVRSKQLNAYILKEVKKPAFNTKNIARYDTTNTLNPKSIKLLEWIDEYYPSNTSASLQLFMPSSILKNKKNEHTVNFAPGFDHKENPKLRKSQAQALSEIRKSKSSTFLLHGDTGSGKTRVYAELVKDSLDANKGALILTPEIGLTSQLAFEIELLTKKSVTVYHSGLTNKERREAWNKILNNKAEIIVGTRSALFTPCEKLGLIVVDEAHDEAYKQEQDPGYHAVNVAAQLGRIHNAQVILGTATPPVSDYALFKNKQLPIIEMSSKSINSKLSTHIVDLTDRSLFTSSQFLSTELLDHLREALKKGEQALLYLNRRGTSRLILCQNCGWEEVCPRCDISLTFHDDTHQVRCHTCGYTKSPPASCPSCKSTDIHYKQIGTKALIHHVQKLFPEARVARFDTDTNKSESLQARFKEIKSGNVDILVGTQLLSKGLDLPNLSLVGIVQADSSLAIPDFSAREKTYQQIHQIIGRVARGHRDGDVVIQTYNPKSRLIKSAISKDYDGFFDDEIKERKAYLYPPFCFMLQITVTKTNAQVAEEAAQNIADNIKKLSIKAAIIGPSPAFKFKSHGKYSWQIIVKSKQRSHLLTVIESLPSSARYNLDPINLL